MADRAIRVDRITGADLVAEIQHVLLTVLQVQIVTVKAG